MSLHQQSSRAQPVPPVPSELALGTPALGVSHQPWWSSSTLWATSAPQKILVLGEEAAWRPPTLQNPADFSKEAQIQPQRGQQSALAPSAAWGTVSSPRAAHGSDFGDGSPSSGNPKPAQETPCSHRNTGPQGQSLLATTEEKKPVGVHKPSCCTSLHGCSVQTSPFPSPMPAPSRDLENTFPLVPFNPSFCFASLIDGKGKSAATLLGQSAASQVRATKHISGTRCRLPTERGLSTRQRAGRGHGVRLW